jgi:S1-C subfamily serine protease
MRLRLQVRLPSGATYPWDHDGPWFRLGRNPACELQFVGEGNQTVSWEHAWLKFHTDGLYLSDLRSSNGTYLNGQRVQCPTRVKPGDEIGLGQTGPRLRVLEFTPEQATGSGGPCPPPFGDEDATVMASVDPPRPDNGGVQRPAPRAAGVPATREGPLAAAAPPFALQGNGRPLTVPPRSSIAAPEQEKRDPPPAKAPPEKLAGNKNHWRVAWIGVSAVALFAVLGVAGFLIFGPEEDDAGRGSGASERGATDPEILQVKEEARQFREEARRAKEEFRQARAEARRVRREGTKRSREDHPLSGPEVYRLTLRSTVFVAVRFKTGARGNGSGALIDKKRRLVLTAYHVVREAVEVNVFFPEYREGEVIADRDHYNHKLNEVSIKCRVVAQNSRTDLAILRLDSVPERAVVLPLARKSPSPGSRVHTVGNPAASAGLWAYTFGAVRQVARRKYMFPTKQTIEAFVVETQNPINKGDSGGPVVNDQIELVAVNSGGGVNIRDGTLCIDVREIKELLAELER